MNEVSCKVLGVFLEPLEQKGVPLKSMVAGTSLSLATIRNRKARIDWPDFVIVMRNLRPHFSDEEYVEMGRSYMRTPGLKFASVIARLLFSAMDFYRWMNKPRDGVGNQMFTCIIPSHRELGANQIEMDLTLPEGLEMCWDFFVISSGNMEELPRLLGLPRAQVELTRIPRGGRYHIVIPKGTPLLTRIRRFFTWPFAVRSAARELQSAHEALVDRFEEIEAARKKLDLQATQLRTAHTLNDLMLRDHDLGRTLDTVVQALVEVAGFTRAEITISTAEGEVPRTACFGPMEHEPLLRRELEVRPGELVGKLAVAPRAEDDPEERDELLALITPTIATGLQNAVYHAHLERLVEERTAELRQARDELAGTVVQLSEAQTARQRFFGNISHEIRTPLTIITLAVSDIESRVGTTLDTRSKVGLGVVADASRKLLRLVDELLLLAAGQEGKLQTTPEPTDLIALMGQLAAAWRPAAEAAHLKLEVRVPEVLLANVDPVAIERVATNLVSNAVKYTPAGGRVDLELAEESAGIRFSVLDTGPGIADELASRLFGRFERSSGEHRRKTGAGIGLHLAKQLVEAHGGTIDAHPRPGGGSELRVTLPRSLVIRDPVKDVATKLRLQEASSESVVSSGDRLTPPGVAKGTILIAEDDIRLAEMSARLLAEEYIVIVAHDGLSALEMVRKHQPQLLITDIDMPGLNGIELAGKFREHTSDKLAPIIILSAMLDLGTRVAGLEAGAVDYITKPFDPLELKARVRAQFRMRELAVQLHRAHQLSAVGVLTSGLAHELRNPANGIVNAMGPLIEQLPAELRKPGSGISQLLDVMQGCSEQIGFLARQLLEFHKEGFRLDVREMDLAELLNRSITLAERALSGVDLKADYESGLTIRCAPQLMTQVLTNLIENAGHAAGYGGWVRVRARAENGRFAIEVADSGPGVPMELRDRVFEPFFTTKPPGVGTGLGLSLARDIIHRHGGRLEIRDQPAPPCFVIDLPAHSAVEELGNALC